MSPRRPQEATRRPPGGPWRPKMRPQEAQNPHQNAGSEASSEALRPRRRKTKGREWGQEGRTALCPGSSQTLVKMQVLRPRRHDGWGPGGPKPRAARVPKRPAERPRAGQTARRHGSQEAQNPRKMLILRPRAGQKARRHGTQEAQNLGPQEDPRVPQGRPEGTTAWGPGEQNQGPQGDPRGPRADQEGTTAWGPGGPKPS